jgi:hypothetical protein
MAETTRPEHPPVPRAFKSLPTDASPEQQLHAVNEALLAYAGIAHFATQSVPKLLAGFEQIKHVVDRLAAEALLDREERKQMAAQFVEHRRELSEQATDISRIHGRLDRVERDVAQLKLRTVPPMRQSLDSINTNIVDHASQEIADKLVAEARNPSTPPQPSPEKIASISKEVLAAAVMTINAKRWEEQEESDRQAKAKQEEEAARAARLRSQTLVAKARARIGFWSAVGIGALGVAERLIEFLVKGHL